MEVMGDLESSLLVERWEQQARWRGMKSGGREGGETAPYPSAQAGAY